MLRNISASVSKRNFELFARGLQSFVKFTTCNFSSNYMVIYTKSMFQFILSIFKTYKCLVLGKIY